MTKDIYEGDRNNFRYVLGKKGNNPLICIGINPSTAMPNDPDPTVGKVIKIASDKGFDGWIMFNVYPQRAPDFKNLDKSPNKKYCEQNEKVIAREIQHVENIHVLCAWGSLIENRDYLFECLKKIYEIFQKRDNVEWLCIGKNKGGHPKHPLYAKVEELREFDMDCYMKVWATL